MHKTSSEALLKAPPSHPVSSRRSGFTLRCLRLMRLLAHLLRGLAIVWWWYPRWDQTRQGRAMRRWSRQLLRILGVRIRIVVAPGKFPARCMIVSNHVSWVDIFVLASRYPAIFVAKSEIRHWPLVGWLCLRAGTLFIERGRHTSARRTNDTIASAISRGQLITVFPEGSTTDGLQVGHFHAALLQPAVNAAAGLQPVALRYLDASGAYSDAPNYVGDMSLMASMWRITGERRIVAELAFADAIPAAGMHRKMLAAIARSAIEQRLGLDTRPEKTSHHSG